GDVLDPSVSGPTVSGARPSAAAVADPLLDPLGVIEVSYVLSTCPPSDEYPDGMSSVRKLASSDRFVLPRSTAPAARNRAAIGASTGGTARSSARAPAVVGS